MVPLARGLRQVRRPWEQDRRAPELERATSWREPDRQAIGGEMSMTDRLFLFVVFVVFLELSFLFEKQFLDQLALLGIGSVFKHRSVMLNVLS
jgi:hypothetical protein